MRTQLFIFILFVCQVTLAQTGKDTLNLYHIGDLVYHSDFEEEAFDCLRENTECNKFMLAMATDPVITAQENENYMAGFYLFLNKLKSDKRFSKKPRTQIKFIFKAIHDEYFKLYKINPLFSEIFTDGIFNCLTASALYALAFEYFKIPYDIIMLTNHVYIVAYPNQFSIVVETTNPMKGAELSISAREKAKAVKELVDMKMVLEEEVNQKGIEKVFTEVYLAQESPDLMELIGSLYYNYALGEAEKMRVKVAYESMKKSSYLHPKLVTTGLLMTYSAILVAQAEYEKPETYRILTEMERFIKYNIPRKALLDHSIALINETMKINKYELVDSAFHWMYNGFTDPYLKDEIYLAYHYNKGLELFKENQKREAFNYIEKAYEVRPDDRDVNMIMGELIAGIIMEQKSVEESYNFLISLEEKHEFLSLNSRFMHFYQVALLELMNQQVVQRNYSGAEKYRAEFEQKFKPEMIEAYETLYFLEQAYSRASLFYFRDNRISNARAVLLSGLKYIPDSYELKSKLNALR